MRQTEMIAALVLAIGLLLKFADLPGYGFAISLSISAIALIYYPLGFAYFNKINIAGIIRSESYAGISGWRLIGTVLLGMALSVSCIGFYFKIMEWPGGGPMVVSGTTFMLLALPLVLFKWIKTKESLYRIILIRIAIIGGAGVLSFLATNQLI